MRVLGAETIPLLKPTLTSATLPMLLRFLPGSSGCQDRPEEHRTSAATKQDDDPLLFFIDSLILAEPPPAAA